MLLISYSLNVTPLHFRSGQDEALTNDTQPGGEHDGRVRDKKKITLKRCCSSSSSDVLNEFNLFQALESCP